MKSTYRILVVVLGSCCANFATAQNWPQAAGPHGDWSIRTEAEVPTAFNVASGENVLWTKPMEESGQSGIVVWNDRLFLSILKPYESEQKTDAKTSTIRALCLDAGSGKTIWEYDIESEGQTGYMGGFSDLTSPSPITDGEYVWFIRRAVQTRRLVVVLQRESDQGQRHAVFHHDDWQLLYLQDEGRGLRRDGVHQIEPAGPAR